jgi:ATP-dependent DNA helicase RecQ
MNNVTTLESNDVYKVLKERFGHTTFKEGQFDIITSILRKRDTLVIKSTGGGKSLCYQLPSVMLKGITIVISPLISLMEDQVSEARKIGRKDVISFHSGLSQQERTMVLNQIHKYRLLYISPEGIQNEQVIKSVQWRGVSLFVVDEAHCISQWGHDFRMDYLELASIRKKIGNPTCLAMTATATEDVKGDIVNSLDLQKPQLFEYTVDRPNIAICLENVSSDKEKIEKIIHLLQNRKDAGMIYFSSRNKAEDVCRVLQNQGFENISYYHGGMNPEERNIIQQQFIEGDLRLICATNAFGMGVNKPDIRFVIHYHYPSNLESYVQEMGRCSRDGKPGLSYIFAQEGDELISYHFLEQEFLDENQIKQLVKYLDFKWKHNQDIILEEIAYQLKSPVQALHFVFFHLDRLGICNYNKSKLHEEMKPFFVDQIKLVELLKEATEKQRYKRLKKITEMNYWIKLNSEHKACRRNYILSYFSQVGTKSTQFCCDLCGIQASWFVKDIDTHQALENQKTLTWQEKVNILWPTK